MGSFGETLRQARLDKGVSLEEAERETRIRRRFLECLENEDFASLPPPVFSRGFIREYCEYLGIAAVPLLEQYRPQGPAGDSVRLRPVAVPIASSKRLPFRGIVLLALVGVGIAGLLYLYGQYTSLTQILEPVPGVASGPVLQGTIQRSAGTAARPTIEVLAAPTATLVTQVVVVTNALERSWVQVWADGKSVFARTVSPGFEQTFTADDSIRMRVGNAGGVEVTVNGSPQGRLGARGQVLDLSWHKP